MPVITTACPRNCYSTCTMRVEVEDGRIRRIEPCPDNAATPEGACLKGLSYVERVVSPDRILTPLRRDCDRFVPVSWDDALDEIESRLRRARDTFGPQSVLHYTGSGTKGLLNGVGAAVALAASLAHLGRKERAWRAILNVRTSWLSREIVLVGSFFVLGTIHALWPRGPGWIGWLATVVGAATLFAVDRVYETVQREPGSDSHSAQTLLTGLFLAGLFGDNGLIVFVIGIMKLLEYLTRKLRFARQGKPARTLTTVLRVGLCLVAPLGAWIFVGKPFPAWVMAAVVVAEAIDRIEFYRDLEFASPTREIRDAVADTA